YSPNVIDISSINKIKTLSYLHVEKCKKLTEFSFLRDNESICDLFLSDVDSLSFIPEMKSIKNLKFWNLKDGDLSYLLNSSTLKTVDFHPDKKSYSHRKDEINKKIGK
ncbi:toxin, partial [Salmonella enterica]|nr:toxin [Salmonella enterica]EAW6872040.1 toxin [Salmonella enterica]ECU1560877.1 toxin [Salmonella enterica subsp. enterica serovar Reading]EIT0475865.1 toxin [Salmonella enterica]